MNMINSEISGLLKKMAIAYTLQDENKNRFRIIAYNNAANTIEQLTTEVKDLWADGKLKEIPGIGASLTDSLGELFKTGRVKHFEQLLKKIPTAVFYLMEIPGMGPKRAYILTKNLKLKSGNESVIDELEKAAKAGKIAEIIGFGEKSEADILKNIADYKKGLRHKQRLILSYTNEIALKIIDYLSQNKKVKRADPLGSLRRMAPTTGDIDISVLTDNNQEVIDWFVKYPGIKRTIEQGPTTASILIENNVQVDLMTQPKESYGTLLAHFTGSKSHNVHLRTVAQKKGWSVSEYGVRGVNGVRGVKKFETEKSFYNFLGMDFIPPELREDTGEIEAAQKHQLPNLVKLSDVKGDLHIHSDYPIQPSHDLGVSTIEEIALRANELGYNYIGLSDHSPSLNNHTPDQIYEILQKRNNFIEQKKSIIKNLHIFIMLEVDILANGQLSMNDKCLNLLDGAIASIHSSFSQDKQTITKRILNALDNPKIKIIGHPTGRLLEERKGYEADWEAIFDRCQKLNKALEISAWPQRLDLPDTLVKQAIKYGVKLIIDSDSHQADQLLLMRYGISVAQRGWATKTDILNTLSYNDFKDWLLTN